MSLPLKNVGIPRLKGVCMKLTVMRRFSENEVMRRFSESEVMRRF